MRCRPSLVRDRITLRRRRCRSTGDWPASRASSRSRAQSPIRSRNTFGVEGDSPADDLVLLVQQVVAVGAVGVVGQDPGVIEPDPALSPRRPALPAMPRAGGRRGSGSGRWRGRCRCSDGARRRCPGSSRGLWPAGPRSRSRARPLRHRGGPGVPGALWPGPPARTGPGRGGPGGVRGWEVNRTSVLNSSWLSIFPQRFHRVFLGGVGHVPPAAARPVIGQGAVATAGSEPSWGSPQRRIGMPARKDLRPVEVKGERIQRGQATERSKRTGWPSISPAWGRSPSAS